MTSPKSFVDFLNERCPEDEKVLVALRFYLAEVTDDKLERELLAEIEDSVGDARKVQAGLTQLEGDREGQVQVALTFLADRWEDPAERDRIIRAFSGAATKMLVIEAGLIAMMSMYAMFLIATGGRRRTTRRLVRRPDNSFEETLEEEMFGPTGPLHAIVSLIRGRATKEES